MPAFAGANTSAASVKSVSTLSKIRSKVSLSRLLNRSPKQNQVYQNPGGNYSFTSQAHPGLVGQPGRFPQGNFSTSNLPQFGSPMGRPQASQSMPNLSHYNSGGFPPSQPMHPARINPPPAHLEGKTFQSAPAWPNNVPYHPHSNMPENAQPIRSDLPPQQLSGQTGAHITQEWKNAGGGKLGTPQPPKPRTEMEYLQEVRLRSPVISQQRTGSYAGDGFMPPSSNFTPDFSATKPDITPTSPSGNFSAIPAKGDDFMPSTPMASYPAKPGTMPPTPDPSPPNTGNFSAFPVKGDDYMPHYSPVGDFAPAPPRANLGNPTPPPSGHSKPHPDSDIDDDFMLPPPIIKTPTPGRENPGAVTTAPSPMVNGGFMPPPTQVKDFAYPVNSSLHAPEPFVQSKPGYTGEYKSPYRTREDEFPAGWTPQQKQSYRTWDKKFERDMDAGLYKDPMPFWKPQQQKDYTNWSNNFDGGLYG